jgi:cytochrome c2
MATETKEETMNRTVLSALAAVGLVAIALTAGTGSRADEAPKLDGKAAFLELKCNMCHAVSAAAIEAKVKSEDMKGPDLTGVTKRMDTAQIAPFVKKEAEHDGKKHKAPWKGTDAQLQAIVDWLGTLEG